MSLDPDLFPVDLDRDWKVPVFGHLFHETSERVRGCGEVGALPEGPDPSVEPCIPLVAGSAYTLTGRDKQGIGNFSHEGESTGRKVIAPQGKATRSSRE